MSTGVSVEDYCGVSDLLARYFRMVDQNRPDEYVALWTEDGVLAITGHKPIVGREAMRVIPRMAFERADGKICHMYTNLSCDYAATPDTVIAEFYELVLDWKSGGAFNMMGLCTATLVRDGAGWKMKRNDVSALR